MKINPKMGGKGEFYIYQVKDDIDIPIYTNNQEKFPNAFHGKLDESTYELVEDKMRI